MRLLKNSDLFGLIAAKRKFNIIYNGGTFMRKRVISNLRKFDCRSGLNFDCRSGLNFGCRSGLNIVLLLILLFSLMGTGFLSAKEDGIFRVGIIGTTTSHVPAVLNLMNGKNPVFKAPENAKIFKQFRVTGVYQGGMPDNESSWSRRDKYAIECEKLGAKIYPTIEELLKNVDGILLESVDGRPHLEQAKPVIAAKKPLFIDKPMAGSLADALEIFRLAKENGTPVFSTSSLRYVKGFQKMRNEKPLGKVLGCDAYSPAHLNEKHPDIYWYGIHGVESLFTIMGPDCASVSRTKTDHYDLAVGIWNDGRVGTFRGIRTGRSGYAAKVFCEKGIEEAGSYEGYEPMFADVCRFFKSGKTSFDSAETVQILAFMSAADESVKKGGAHISLKDTIEKAKKEKRVTVELQLAKDGSATWNGTPVKLEQIPAKIASQSADGSVVRVIMNNRVGANFEIVQKYLQAVDKAFLANYLY